MGAEGPAGEGDGPGQARRKLIDRAPAEHLLQSLPERLDSSPVLHWAEGEAEPWLDTPTAQRCSDLTANGANSKPGAGSFCRRTHHERVEFPTFWSDFPKIAPA